MPRRPTKEDVEELEDKPPIPKPPHEVQKIYLEIMSRIGDLERSAPPELRPDFRELGIKMCRVKRKWIGVIDELRADYS